MVACTPVNQPTPFAETPLPPEAATPLATEPAPTLVPTSLPEITATSTLEPSPTVTLAPTSLPSPAYTHMGIELVDNNFVSQVPLIAEAGAGWVRYNSVSWYSIEFQEGTRNWAQAAGLDARAQAASEAGLNFIAIVLHAPPWAQAIPGYA
ncbi:MAG TPA: hypothetical protein PK530_10595, partial [Anaerolineales bacterium]|nr:hypothetical protein [Anaerolineales bacterium]